ncbi:hypothetical protein BD410DRAFT_744017 [Rickenella mellea]|uniref:BTB domain-containing protein n=1 Tax=Rickenella mellea TaxID=50990 RepID=A0A4Y7QCG9_9AGAM|nr:hypothetical protein BD410DRAFT_744017 [Rickenella mellea]
MSSKHKIPTDDGTNSSHPAKRTKGLSQPDKVAKDNVKSVEVWFDDGNIVVGVDTTTKGLDLRPVHPASEQRHLFKVHKSVLGMHSPVWKDMFELPQPRHSNMDETTEDEYEGVPLMILPDTLKDVRDLLMLMYKPTQFNFNRLDSGTVSKVSGILKLSKKYQIDAFREHIAQMLRQDWPTDLAAWDQNDAYVKQRIMGMSNDEVFCAFAEPSSVINLAHEFGIKEILPAAFYHLSRVFWMFYDDECFSSPRRTSAELLFAKREPLSHMDLRNLIFGRDVLRTQIMRLFQRLKHNIELRETFEFVCFGSSGSRKWPCRKQYSEWWTGAHHLFFTIPEGECHPLRLYDPLDTLIELISGLNSWDARTTAEPTKPFCHSCREHVISVITKERQTIWSNLGYWFSIAS